MILLVGLLPVGRLAAEGNSSLSESKIENAEHAATAENLTAENEQLRRQVAIDQESLKVLTSSLAQSNEEAEMYRRKFADLELRMEALGLAAANKDRAKLEQRLLAAVSDLQLAQKERDDYRDQMLRLNEAILRYLKRHRAAMRKREWTSKRNCAAQTSWSHARMTRRTLRSPV
jgi:FtsZ-binding cell division protein ZapB